MTPLAASILCLLWLAWAVVSPTLVANSRGDVAWGALWHVGRLYVRFMHRLSVVGEENIPSDPHAGPFIIVVNHTAGVDPVLVQSRCRFHIDWMMGRDMMLPAAARFWEWAGIIPVDRFGRDTTAAREAIRRLGEGGVIGIFPEGGLEEPPRHIMPFIAGVGLIIRRTGAPVIPVVLDGTPQVRPAWAALWTRSRSTMRVLPPIDYRQSRMSAEEIASDLEARFKAWTGWPAAPTGFRSRTPL